MASYEGSEPDFGYSGQELGPPPEGMYWEYNPDTGQYELKPTIPGWVPPQGGSGFSGLPPGHPDLNRPPDNRPPDNRPPGGGGGGGGGITRPPMLTPPPFGQYPMFDAPHYTKPPDFSYAAFVQPTLADAQNEPGYQFAMTEGRKALENSAAGQGVLRTGGTLKDILAWGNQFAEQNYGNVYNRAANTYGINRENAFGNYKLNLDAGLSAYDRLFQEASAEYAPQARAFELQSARDWDAFVYGGDDAWRRYLADLDIAKTIYGGG